MAKLIKTAGIVIGAAALIATGAGALFGAAAVTGALGGISASTLLMTSSGLAMASSLLQKKPEVPKAQTDRLTASVDPRAFRKAPMGQTAFPVDVRYEEWSGNDQDYCDWIVCVASCAVESAADEIWLNQELAWTRAGGVEGKFKNYLWVPNIINEGTPANAFAFGSGKWNATRRLTGCAYLRLRFKVTGNGKKGESPFASGIPSRITIVGRGSKLYDPRRDSTVPGGSGPMRADDQSTWRYVAQDGASIGENLPLHVLRDLLGWRIQNPATGEWKLAVGCGIPKKRIDLQSFIVAANIADELATRSSGGTEPKYHGACVLSEGEDPRSRQDTLLAACNGRLQDANGKLAIRIAHNDLAAAALDEGLGDDDVVGGFTWDPDPSLEQTPNVVRGKYIDPSPASLYQPVDYPEVRIPSLDGIDRSMSMDLGAVESPSHAQRIVKQALQRKQYARHFAAPFDITAWRYNIGDLVPFTFAPLSFKRKLFRIVEMDPRSNPCPVVLREEHAAIYQWDADDRAAVQAAEPIVYDWAKNPLILAIDDAGRSAEWSGIADDDGNKPADNATNSADPNSPFGPDSTVGQFRSDMAAAKSQIAGALDDLDTAKTQIETVLDDINLHDLTITAQDASIRQAERMGEAFGATLLDALLQVRKVRARQRDAGIYVDPDTGQVRIYGLEQAGERLSQAEFLLDGVAATLSLKASVSYVDTAIAQAVLDPSQLPEFGNLQVRINSAEVAIDGIRASVLTKADAATVSSLAGVISSVSTNLDALANTVTTKADKTTVDQLGVRITTAEQTLGAIGEVGDVVGLVTNIRQARFENEQTAEALLRDMLAGRKGRIGLMRQLALIQQELTTKIIDDVSAEASSRLLLVAEMARNAASVAQQMQALVTADSSTASALASLTAQLTTLSDTITAEVRRLDTADATERNARAQAVSDINASIGSANASIGSLQQAVADEVSARAQAVTNINTALGNANAALATLQKAVSDNAGASAAAIQSLTATVGSVQASIIDTRSVAVDAQGKANAIIGMTSDVNGRITGTRSVNDGVRTKFSVLADHFEVVSEGGGFEVKGPLAQVVDENGDWIVRQGKWS